MEEQNEVQGANDPSISSREKDALFADEPRPQDRAEGDVQPQGQDVGIDSTAEERQQALEDHERMVADSNGGYYKENETDGVIPRRHESGGPYDDGAADATVEDADFEVEETNKKGQDSV